MVINKFRYNYNFLSNFSMLPQEIQDRIFLELGSDNIGFVTLKRTRMLQSPYVRRSTQFNNIGDAILLGNLTNIKHLYKLGHNFFIYDVYTACAYGHLDIIKWMYENNNYKFHLCERMFYEAITSGNLDMVKWLHSIDCQADESAVYAAIMLDIWNINANSNNGLKILKWLLENNFPAHKWVPVNTENIEMVQYLKENGFTFRKL